MEGLERSGRPGMEPLRRKVSGGNSCNPLGLPRCGQHVLSVDHTTPSNPGRRGSTSFPTQGLASTTERSPSSESKPLSVPFPSELDLPDADLVALP